MNLRLYYQTLGGHVHVRVFSGKSKELTHGKNGDLVFSVEEWPVMYAKFTSIAEVRPEHKGERECNCQIDAHDFDCPIHNTVTP